MEINSEVWSQFPYNVFSEMPKYIKNCVQRTGFDTLATIQTIKNEDFTEIEDTLKSDNVDNFKFVLGHRRLIIKMAEFATKILENPVPERRPEPEKKSVTHPNPAQVK